MKKDIIAMVGAGEGGKAILSNLLRIPGIYIKYVCDVNPEAPAIQLAKDNNITVCYDNWEGILAADSDLDLVFEVTGEESVFQKLIATKPTNCVLVGAAATKIIFHLLDNQDSIMHQLEAYKSGLELKIIERTEELEKANQNLEDKILQYERLNEKLQQINNEKTKYLLHATHQLKAPFAAIQSYADIVMEGYTGEIPEKTQEIMGKIKNRCNLLARSIKEMLELANLRTCLEENIKMEHMSVSAMLEPIVESFTAVGDKRNIKLNFTPYTEGFDVVKANNEQMSILFNTIVENAINYSHDNSQVEVTVSSPREHKIRIDIADHGIGIAAESVPKVFGEYFRTNNAVKHHNNGTGLGLSIAKEIVKLHFGTIDLVSDEGKGTTFSIIFPLQPADNIDS
jgi:signal transduction histidine kinase